MTEQDVHNTLHSFDVIKQLQTSGQSFEDFFEENKDLVKNEYSHEFKFLYYSYSTHRVWITDDCFLEHKRTMDFNGYTTDEILEFPINVFVDLEKMSLVKRYDNNREFDNEKYFGESEDKMYMILGNLEFDELVSVPDYVREEIEKDNALDMTNNRSLSL